jgi:hypothetical protein
VSHYFRIIAVSCQPPPPQAASHPLAVFSPLDLVDDACLNDAAAVNYCRRGLLRLRLERVAFASSMHEQWGGSTFILLIL